MIDAKSIQLIRELWAIVVGDTFTPTKLADRVRADGGQDFESLSERDVLDLIEGRFSGSWNEVAFAFSELLAYYSVPDAPFTGEQVVAWAFASIVIAHAIDKGATDWELQFNIFIHGFLKARTTLETENSVRVFESVFCRSSSGSQT